MNHFEGRPQDDPYDYLTENENMEIGFRTEIITLRVVRRTTSHEYLNESQKLRTGFSHGMTLRVVLRTNPTFV